MKLDDALRSRTSIFDLPIPSPHLIPGLREAAACPEPDRATPSDIDAALTQLAIALPRRRDDDVVAEAKLDIYANALADLTRIDLVAACDGLIKTAKFFPTVSEIRAAAHPTMSRRSYRRSRARMMILRFEREFLPPGELSENEQAAARDIASGAKIGGRPC